MMEQMIFPSDLPELCYLESLFNVDFDKGILYWKTRPLHHFTKEADAKTWNTRFSGKRAGAVYTNKYGYSRRGVRVDGKRYTEHHVIWYMYFKQPVDKTIYQIDHIDRNACNNSVSNLRLVSRVENAANRVLKGYYFSCTKKRWVVTFETKGMRRFRAEVECENLASLLYKYMACCYHGKYSKHFPFLNDLPITSYKGVTENTLMFLQETLPFSVSEDFVMQVLNNSPSGL